MEQPSTSPNIAWIIKMTWFYSFFSLLVIHQDLKCEMHHWSLSVRDAINGGIWKHRSIFVEPLGYSCSNNTFQKKDRLNKRYYRRIIYNVKTLHFQHFLHLLWSKYLCSLIRKKPSFSCIYGIFLIKWIIIALCIVFLHSKMTSSKKKL